MKEVHGWEVWYEGQEAKKVFYPENRQGAGIIACAADARAQHKRTNKKDRHLPMHCVEVTRPIKVENVFTSNTAPAPAEEKEAPAQVLRTFPPASDPSVPFPKKKK